MANGRVNRLARDPIADIFAVAPTFENIGFHYEEPGPLGSPADQPAAKLASGTHGVGTAADGGRLRGERVAGYPGVGNGTPLLLPGSISQGVGLDGPVQNLCIRQVIGNSKGGPIPVFGRFTG